MSRNKIDVETQFRAWQKEQKKNVPVSFMDWQNLELNMPVVVPLLIVTVITSLLIMMVPFVGRNGSKKSRFDLGRRFAKNLPKSRALLFASWFNPFVFSTFLAVWIVLCAINAVFQLMRVASTDPEGTKNVVQTTAAFFQPAVLLFILQYWGITCLLIHVVFSAEYYIIGSAMSFLPFLASFYQAMALSGDEVDHWPVLCINMGLLLSFGVTVAFTVPWLKNEYRIAMRDLNAHTTNVLGYHRKAEKVVEQKKRK
ncbi:uncharacterized protein TM35_000141850 [Trypanosoma theileri]|uniref:Uncharacterized protein n=1 Tax=Trypanosoma theileri TaxID=67003 RepID=A0A1X0NW94_9TRYP|nr:uncharacterized protein TM35_000141850 [Trypanosoma theileri]ORC88974.1 hypothetical protein TM35_000141850 [Trypanosoma theileri]